MPPISAFTEFETKMRAAPCSEAAIRAFRHSWETMAAGNSGLLPENAIEPVTELPRAEDCAPTGDGNLLAQAAVLKLNGGLGTGMGLEKAKSLLVIKDGLTFLDFIARQILHLRERHQSSLRFLVMNSFSTSRDTRAFLERYPALGQPADLELMQNAVPKVDAQTLGPVVWPKHPEQEWCPPGHGDLYPALLGSGRLDQLLAAGVKYLFVSNSDNLGATLDPGLLHWFATSGQSFLMEVCERTASDRKGGHLARRAGRFILRESAQCPEADLASFQDIQRHRFFNTNNLWIRLDRLKELLAVSGGFLPLPIIQNAKTADPRDPLSPKVFQLETAMGAAIECFENSGAVVVPRARFAPVKTTADLLALRSDAYQVTDDWRMVLAEARKGVPPMIDLDSARYKMVDQLDAALTGGVPSLVQCRELTVRGPVRFGTRQTFIGRVSLTNQSSEPKELPAGEYRDTAVDLTARPA